MLAMRDLDYMPVIICCFFSQVLGFCNRMQVLFVSTLSTPSSSSYLRKLLPDALADLALSVRARLG